MIRPTRVYRGPRIGTFTIYGIVDSRSGKFVYVGQTSNFEQRKRSHLRKLEDGRKRARMVGTNIDSWIYDALNAKVTPVIVALETVETWEESLKSELEWVHRLGAENHPLLNKWVEHKEAIRAAVAGSPGRPRTLTADISSSPIVQRPWVPRISREKTSVRQETKAEEGNYGLPWTKAFDEQLVAHYKAGAGAQDIASQMRRTPIAIRARLVRLGLIDERRDLRN